MKISLKTFEFSAIEEYFSRNKKIIIFSVIAAIICYGYELFNFSLTIDEELNSLSKAADLKMWIKNGRWGTYFLNLIILPHSIMPYLPTLIAILGIAFSAVLFVNSEKGDFRTKIIFCLIFISYPLHSYYIAFNVFSMQIGIGLVLSVLGYLLVKRNIEEKAPKITLIIPILILAFSFSFYQALIPIFILLTVFYLYQYLITDENATTQKLFAHALMFFSVWCLSLLLYKMIDILANTFLLDNEFKSRADYLDVYRGWAKLSIKEILSMNVHLTIDYLVGKRFYGGISIISILFLVPFLLYSTFIKIRKVHLKFEAAGLLLFMCLTPFLVMFAIGSQLQPRSLPALPLLFGIILWLSYQYFNPLMKRLLLIVVFFIFISNTYYTTRLFYSSNVAYEADRDMANRIIERIYSLDMPSNKDNIPVAFVGRYEPKANELFFKTNDVFGASFFNWDGGNPHRMVAFFKTIGINNIEVVPKTEAAKDIELIQKMPSWPSKGSVFYNGSYVIVKLSNDPRIEKLAK